MNRNPVTPKFAETLANLALLLPEVPEQCYDKLEGIAIGMKLRPTELRKQPTVDPPDIEHPNDQETA